MQWIEGRCLSYATNVTYQFWLDMLRELLGVAPDAPPAAVRDALHEHVQTLCADCFDEVYPYLGRMMYLPLEGAIEARLRGLDAESLQFITFGAVETLLERAAAQRPLVVVCEDLHWADATSLALLEHTLPLTDRVPLLFVCLLRPEREHPCWQIVETAARSYDHSHTDLRLRPLSVHESEVLVGNLLHVEDLPQALRARILEHAEGNPFFVEEILRSLIDDGTIAHDEQSDCWQATRDIADILIPDTLHGVVTTRIDRLPGGTKRVLQLASVIGRIFAYPVLSAVAIKDAPLSPGGERMGVRGKALNPHLLALQRAQLIRERARLPEREYAFKHVLTQEAAYSGLLRRERRVNHRRVGEALERLYPERIEEQLGLLAHHWEQAGETGRAVEYLRRAGEQAAAQYANDEAVGYLSRALDLVPEDRGAKWNVERYALLLVREGVYDMQGAREAQARDLTALQEVAEKIEEEGRPAGVRIAEVALRQANYYEETSDYTSALEAVRRAIEQVERAHEPGTGQAPERTQAAMEGYITWGKVLCRQGSYETARAPLERALALAREARDRRGEARSLYSLGDVYLYQGNYPEARERYQQALEIYRASGDRPGEADSLTNLGVICGETGDLPGARDYYEQALRILQAIGDRRGQTMPLNNLGVIYCDMGDYQAARNYHEQCLDLRLAIGDRWGEATGLVNLALIYHNLGEDRTARQYTERALAIQRAIGNRRGEGYSLTYRGHALAGLGELDAAAQAYDEAMHLRHELGQHALAIDALAGLARVSLTLGDAERAREQVDEILAWIETNGPEGIEYPLQVALTCYRVLRATEDSRAEDVLNAAHRLLQEQADKIDDEALRRSFLENVATHREIIGEWEGRQR